MEHALPAERPASAARFRVGRVSLVGDAARAFAELGRTKASTRASRMPTTSGGSSRPLRGDVDVLASYEQERRPTAADVLGLPRGSIARTTLARRGLGRRGEPGHLPAPDRLPRRPAHARGATRARSDRGRRPRTRRALLPRLGMALAALRSLSRSALDRARLGEHGRATAAALASAGARPERSTSPPASRMTPGSPSWTAGAPSIAPTMWRSGARRRSWFARTATSEWRPMTASRG